MGGCIMTVSEEIEVNVRQLEDPEAEPETSVQVLEVVRKLMLAGFGALALSRDEAETFLNRLVERGELAQKDAQKLIEENVDRFRKSNPQPGDELQSNIANLGASVENSLEQFLNRLNIPSKRDIDDLSAKIAQLAARVEELRRGQETGSKPRTTKTTEAKPEA
jgi:poly(hydroxyalkanoate) granule-associated protein